MCAEAIPCIQLPLPPKPKRLSLHFQSSVLQRKQRNTEEKSLVMLQQQQNAKLAHVTVSNVGGAALSASHISSSSFSTGTGVSTLSSALGSEDSCDCTSSGDCVFSLASLSASSPYVGNSELLPTQLTSRRHGARSVVCSTTYEASMVQSRESEKDEGADSFKTSDEGQRSESICSEEHMNVYVCGEGGKEEVSFNIGSSSSSTPEKKFRRLKKCGVSDMGEEEEVSQLWSQTCAIGFQNEQGERKGGRRVELCEAKKGKEEGKRGRDEAFEKVGRQERSLEKKRRRLKRGGEQTYRHLLSPMSRTSLNRLQELEAEESKDGYIYIC